LLARDPAEVADMSLRVRSSSFESCLSASRKFDEQERTERISRMNYLHALSGALVWRKGAVMPVESCIPVIPSANLQKSLRLWVDGLGFSVSSEMREGDTLIFCILRKTTYGLC
jgi:hypothetical protein